MLSPDSANPIGSFQVLQHPSLVPGIRSQADHGTPQGVLGDSAMPKRTLFVLLG
jgi:hypothetical protein